MTDVSKLKSLGSNKTDYKYGLEGEAPNPDVLERFENPSAEKASKGGIKVDIEAPEFTSMCPKTGQPDSATIVISYAPEFWCVESKSLKLYLMEFRMFGEFHEGCVTRIGNDLVALLDPHALTVVGRFAARGGIKFWPQFIYQRQIEGPKLVSL